MIKKLLKKLLKMFNRFKNYFKFIWISNKETRKSLSDASSKLKIELGSNSLLKIEMPCFTNEPNCLICVRENAKVDIGSKTFFNRNCIIVSRNSISIGANCLFGPNVYICDHDHVFDETTVYTDRFKSAPVFIGDGTWIGANCVILKGTRIGKNCVIGAGSVITENVPDGMIVLQKKVNTIYERKSNV